MSAGSATTTTTYNCGRCRQPLSLRTTSASESLVNLRESQYDLLASQITFNDATAAAGPANSSNKDDSNDRTKLLNAITQASTSAGSSGANGSSAGGSILPRKVVAVSPARQSNAQQKLFDALSAQSEIDFPLCTECAEGRCFLLSVESHMKNSSF